MMRNRAKASEGSPPGQVQFPAPTPSPTTPRRSDTCKVAALGFIVFALLFVILLGSQFDEDEDNGIAVDTHPPPLTRRDTPAIADTLFVESCPMFPTPHPLRKQRCCQFTAPYWHCLPNLVIAGTQKSGTTALFSYLMNHPQILPGAKKEFHVFDFDRSYMQLKPKLHQLLPRQEEADLLHFVVMDSTPTYIADSKACPRMSHILSPDAKFVVLLRNPVDRLWSDVQMKQRRIDAQNEFKLDLLPRFHREVAYCMSRESLVANLTAFRACLPQELAQHGRIAAFHKHFASAKQRNTKAHVKFVSECLGSEIKAKECEEMSRILKETMPNIPQVIYDETAKLDRVMETCCNNNLEVSTKPKLERQNAFYGALPMDMGCGVDCFPQAKMMSDISKNFVWRSMYSKQLKHCFASISSERFLVINSDELKLQPARTLQRILLHAGLDITINLADYTQQEIQQAFQDRYPDFETMTGWRRHSANHTEIDMSPELRAHLQDFFRKYNRELFDLLKIQPYSGWNV